MSIKNGYWRRRVKKALTAIAVASLSCLAVLPAAAQPFSLIVMPDAQYYTTSNHPALYNLYQRQTQWIRNNQSNYNIKHVIWVGDLTNDNTTNQWLTAHSAYNVLDAAGIPFAVVPGNHDYKTTATGWPGSHRRDLTNYNIIVGPKRFNSKAWYGGNMGETTTDNANNYTYFSSDGVDFLVVGLEYAPRKEVLTWANNLISQHPNHHVVIFTHGYMTTNGAYTGGAGSSFGMVGADGRDIFEECASRHSNVFMVVCGHVTESVVNLKSGVNGNPIYEMLVDYQGEQVKGTGANLGNGWLRILQFDPPNKRIIASTVTAAPGDTNIFLNGETKFYNNRYGSSPTAPDHLFTLAYDMTTPKPYSYLNSSVGFHAMAVTNDLLSDQLDPDIAQAANANWAAVWEDDHDANGIYQVTLRGFDPDGNVRFDKVVVNTDGANVTNAVNPSIAMAADGRFVVAWQNGSTAIKARSFNADGTPIGTQDQTIVSVTSPGTVNNPDVAIDDAGNFVVTWADDGDGNGAFQVRARGLTANYQQRFAAKTINTIASGNQVNPAIAMAGNGDYIIVWEDDKDGTWDLGMRGFFANETERFTQRLANDITTGEQVSPAIAMDNTGRFVVVWEDDLDLNNSYQVLARGFNSSGNQLFAQLTVNQLSSGNQLNPAVAMDSFGNWYPAWEDNGVSGSGYQIMANAFNINGIRIHSSDERANPVTSVTNREGSTVRRNPAVSAHKSGRYVVMWMDDMDGDGIHQALARGMAGTARNLAVSAMGGTVTKSPEDAFYPPNATVTLTASNEPGKSFIRWTGDVPGGSTTANPLTVVMNDTKAITAEFNGASDVDDWQLY